MGRRLLLLALGALVAVPAGARAATPCDAAGAPAPVCVGADKVTDRGTDATAIGAYGRSWTHRALTLQRELGGAVPFVDAPWIGTHNSFNSTSESPTVSHADSNQQLTLGQQLDLDVRSLELDLHWVASARSGGPAPVVCHARGEDEGHAGCTTERTLAERLPEVAAWVAAHPHDVLLLYL
jgi:hypothetical protein